MTTKHPAIMEARRASRGLSAEFTYSDYRLVAPQDLYEEVFSDARTLAQYSVGLDSDQASAYAHLRACGVLLEYAAGDPQHLADCLANTMQFPPSSGTRD